MTKQTTQPKPFSMPIGNKLESNIETYHPGFRSIEQFETVRSIANRKEFAFSCSQKQMFQPEKPSTYQGPFMFLWYDKQQQLHGYWIGKKGKILKDIKPS